MTRQAFLVLSMHRSGTSTLAGLLVRLGVEGPRTLMPPDSFNPLGYWESEPIAEYHDRLLRSAHTSWGRVDRRQLRMGRVACCDRDGS